MKIGFIYSDGDEESIVLTEEAARRELMNFLGRFSDSGKRQWMSKMQNKDYPSPMQDAHYQHLIERMENSIF